MAANGRLMTCFDLSSDEPCAHPTLSIQSFSVRPEAVEDMPGGHLQYSLFALCWNLCLTEIEDLEVRQKQLSMNFHPLRVWPV